MKNLFRKLFEFLETKSGLLLLGFLASTVCGTLLNDQIQTKQSENEHSFEMYKTRLSEAKSLQAKLLENSNSRSFYLQQVLIKLAHPEEYTPDKINKFWSENVTPTKDLWNKDLYYLHAQARVLFTSALADTILVYEENKPIVHDAVTEKLNDAIYNKTIPKSLQGAFVDTHATIYYIFKKCSLSKDCDRANLVKLAEKQLKNLELVQSCLAYRISSELLRYPYGPNADLTIQMPNQCVVSGIKPISYQLKAW